MNASAERADTVAINRRMTHFDGHSQVSDKGREVIKSP